ncbi:MAG: dicarboxylate/amino acid:cation symporter [Crocinitomicaceae bacterium]
METPERINDFFGLKHLSGYLQQLVESKLWVKVIIALILGATVGFFMSPSMGLLSESASVSIGGWMALPGKLFLKLVQMIMIPLIVTSIMSGLVNAGKEQLRKIGGGLLIYFVITTTIAVTIGYLLSVLIRPGRHFTGLLPSASSNETLENTASSSPFSDIPTVISELLPDNPLASMVSGEMLSIVIFSIIIGIAIINLKKAQLEPVNQLINSIQEICMVVVKWAMRLVPFAVFGLIAQLMSTIGFSSLESVGLYVLTVLAGLALLLLIYLILITVLGNMNPFTFLRSIKDVQLLAFSTTSSAAVMPLSIKVAQEKLDVEKGISNFIIPIGATINMDGTALFQVISTIFIIQAYGIEMDVIALLLVMVTIIAASIGTPAIPGGGVVVLASVLQSSGIPAEGIVLIIGVERILGMFRTAINVTGDLTACVIFNRFASREKIVSEPVN